jgi:leucyl-tRNA synthetase
MKSYPRSVVETFILLLAPFAPHICEELWSKLGHRETLAYHPWPAYDAELAREERIEYAVQINGRLRHKVRADSAGDNASIVDAIKADAAVSAALAGKTILREIVVPGRLVNFVVE